MIRFENLTKRYGATEAVASLTLSVEAGEAVALLGPNGSGKTTSLKAAAGLIRPTEGRVVVGDPPENALRPSARRTISYLPQKVAFPDALTGREVLEFYRALRSAPVGRTADVLKFASLNGASNRAVGTYSGGMVQRLGLAGAVLPNAPVLLLDEPTAALDPDGLCAFYGLVERRRREGHTLFFTSHQMGDVERLADRLLLLVEGRLAASLSQAELARRLGERGVMRLSLDRRPEGLLERVRAIAPGASWAAEDLVVPGPAWERPRVIALVAASGAEIRNLVAREGRLDELYRELLPAIQRSSEPGNAA
ncbi:MAG TPA: ABC transporter ATP-binding protein [Thermoanaerobaculia bacterium]|nr:ABC transporter ATP-binding protein [Thermoanaerobaculia bacterium]